MNTAGEVLDFKPSKPFTVGVEWELQLLDGENFDLADRVLPVLELFPDNPWIKPEFIQSCVEINSRVCDRVEALEAHVRQILTELLQRCEQLGLVLAGAGTHPFCRRLALITPLPRYLRQKAIYGYLARTQITFATHVHLGMPDAETAVALMTEMRAYLPVLIGISANSPFWRGYDTGFACYRQRILASGRSYGIPPGFADWKAFCRFFEVARRAGVFESVRDIHWDVRPRPVLGTLEVRVMDAQSSLRDLIALATFVRCLAAWLRATPVEERPPLLPRPLPWWLEKENYFQANRLGIHANYIDADARVYPLKDVVEVLLVELRKQAGDWERRQLAYLQQGLAENCGWQRQKKAFALSRRMPAVVQDLARQLYALT